MNEKIFGGLGTETQVLYDQRSRDWEMLAELREINKGINTLIQMLELTATETMKVILEQRNSLRFLVAATKLPENKRENDPR